VPARPSPAAHPSGLPSLVKQEKEHFSEVDETALIPAYQSAFWSSPGLMVVAVVVVIAGLLAGGLYWKIRSTAHKATITAVSAKPQPPVPKVNSLADSPTASPTSSPSSAPADPVLTRPTPTALADANSSAAPRVAQTESSPLTAEEESKQASPTVLPQINGIRHWSSANASTVVIDLEDQVPYEVHRLSSPERIYFDLHDTVLPSSLDGKMIEVGDAQVSRVRVAQPEKGVTRVVLDTNGGSNFSVSLEPNPYRLVVEVRGLHAASAETRAKVDVNRPANQRENKATKTAALARDREDVQLRAHVPKFRVVLDAGHGGWDLGTVGRKGLMEKDLVLDIVQRLGELLEARLGSEVIYTRKEDAYISLDQRADVANQAQADLFVSIHANYSDSASARGVETYYTDLFEAPGSKEIEKRENGSVKKAIMPASLSTTGLREKVDGSRQLAAAVQRALYDTLAQLSPSIRNRGVKRASFVVLTGTAMPSILAEVSFVSSPRDEQNLQNARYRQRIALALYKGIARYAAGSPRVKLASASGASTGQ
jgi:N-acetylmuramoyl-L-alanine amidase